MLQGSYTVSPLDPKAKLFYNPAFNQEQLRGSSVEPARAAAYMPLSARGAAPERPPAPLQRSMTARVGGEGSWGAGALPGLLPAVSFRLLSCCAGCCMQPAF